MGIRPSEFYKIADEVVAWSFDRAVLRFGGALEAELQEISKNSKRRASAERRMQMTFDSWMDSGADKGTRKFRDPRAGR